MSTSDYIKYHFLPRAIKVGSKSSSVEPLGLPVAFYIIQEFKVVLFMDGTLPSPATRISRQVVQQLDAFGLPFKARDLPWFATGNSWVTIYHESDRVS